MESTSHGKCTSVSNPNSGDSSIFKIEARSSHIRGACSVACVTQSRPLSFWTTIPGSLTARNVKAIGIPSKASASSKIL